MSFDYRADIDGLRAIAVVPVLLFHAGLAGCSGGYVGVDIFFVISGYLITGILVQDIERGRYSIATFYARRIRRIFPALFAVLSCSTLAAWWLLLPSELVDFGKNLFAAALFYSNCLLMHSTGYFAAPAETKPLLHLWSLAVEEQFYILFPLYLHVVHRYCKHHIGPITWVALALSLIYSLVLVQKAPEDAFYSTPARAWELMTGAILALYPRKTALNFMSASLLGFLGLGAVLYSIFMFSKDTPFPGAMALVPVVGAALIIYSGADNTLWVSRLLATAGFRGIGVISYSLYLWHWPVLVFYKHYAMGPLATSELLIFLGLIFTLSYLSWRFIETPFRTGRRLARPSALMLSGGGLMLASLLCAALLVAFRGLPFRFPDPINHILSAENDSSTLESCTSIRTTTGLTLPLCSIGGDTEGDVSFAVWGDSHGGAMLPGIEAAARRHQARGVFVGRGGCLPLLNVHQVRQGYGSCVATADAFMAYLAEHAEIRQVILVSRWALYAMGTRFGNEIGHEVFIRDNLSRELSFAENQRAFERSFQRTIEKLSGLGKRIVIVTQVPETEWNLPTALARATLFNRDLDFRPRLVDYLDRQAFVTHVIQAVKSKHSLEIVHPEAEMCPNQHCLVVDSGMPIYRDSSHLTKRYAEKLSHIFDPVFLPPPEVGPEYPSGTPRPEAPPGIPLG